MKFMKSMDRIKPKVLSFLENLKEDDVKFDFSPNIKGNIYSSIIALYIYDLLDQVKFFSDDRKNSWVQFIKMMDILYLIIRLKIDQNEIIFN